MFFFCIKGNTPAFEIVVKQAEQSPKIILEKFVVMLVISETLYQAVCIWVTHNKEKIVSCLPVIFLMCTIAQIVRSLRS